MCRSFGISEIGSREYELLDIASVKFAIEKVTIGKGLALSVSTFGDLKVQCSTIGFMESRVSISRA
jgi:hypothetical protein